MSHLTPALKSLLEQYRKGLSSAEADSFENEVHRRIEMLMAHLMTFDSGVSRGREVQRLVDNEVAAASNIKVSCQKGCAACCHLEVQITNDDAEVLRESLSNGLKVDLERLRELSERKRGDPLWRAGAAPMNRCVFLSSENTCRTYENRPAVCRKAAVISPAIDCSTIGAFPQPLMIPMAEIVISASLSIEGTRFGSLSGMLQDSLDKAALHEVPQEKAQDSEF